MVAADTRLFLSEAWAHTDRLFALLGEGAIHAQPIPLRQPFLFYLGHLPAFAWSHLGRRAGGLPSFQPRLDELFDRGIDPVGVDAYEPSAEWPPMDEVLGYRDEVRRRLAERLGEGNEESGFRTTALMVLEHELMHQETLLYMLQQLPHGGKRRPADWPDLPAGKGRPGGRVRVPAGRALLGTQRGSLEFAWDNELPEHVVDVPAFQIDRTPVTNAEFLEFVEAGGYGVRGLWDAETWDWRERQDLRHPRFWSAGADGFAYHALFEDLPLARVADWPVSVSWAEAAAFASWKGARLPTEAEFHRAAYGSEEGTRPWPWGDAAPLAAHGNFGFRHGSPLPVGAHPAGQSAWGALELVGNGWEWTSTPFGPFEGFQPMPGYPGYSADFFDRRHYVMLGASWATADRLVRRGFRNWFQPHYPYVFGKFRCVHGG